MKLSALVVGLLLVSSCEKSGPAEMNESGAPSKDESALLQYLPPGSTALFGGNYMKFQNFLQNSPLAKVMASLDKSSPGINEWMKCWIDFSDIKMLGSVAIKTGAAEMRFAMTGVTFAQLETCAKRASFTSVIDPDNKYMGFEMPTAAGTMKTGYLLLPSGAIYTRQAIPLKQPMVPAPVVRADLEADMAALASGTAEKDTALIAAMKKVDRKKAMWFVGSGAGTPVSDKLGLVSGTFDLATGLAMDVSAELKQSALADKIEQGVAEAKKQVDKIGGATGEVVKALQVSRKGDTIRMVLSISNDQLTAMMAQLGPMMGGMGGRP
ncbi:hypothetical protein BH11MYX3_BH11MYX3_37730 [soil metagenome]